VPPRISGALRSRERGEGRLYLGQRVKPPYMHESVTCVAVRMHIDLVRKRAVYAEKGGFDNCPYTHF
jgi:hypothetical protein